MALYKNVDGKRVEMSSQEEGLTRAEWARKDDESPVLRPAPDLVAATQHIIDALSASGMDMTGAQEAMDIEK